MERNENKTEKKAKKTMVGADENLLGVPFDRGPFFECSSKYSFLFSSFFFFSSFFSSSPFTSSFSIAFVPFLAVVVEPANGAGVKRIGRSNQRPIRHAWISPPNETKKKERREQGKETAATKTASPPQRPLLFRSWLGRCTCNKNLPRQPVYCISVTLRSSSFYGLRGNPQQKSNGHVLLSTTLSKLVRVLASLVSIFFWCFPIMKWKLVMEISSEVRPSDLVDSGRPCIKSSRDANQPISVQGTRSDVSANDADRCVNWVSDFQLSMLVFFSFSVTVRIAPFSFHHFRMNDSKSMSRSRFHTTQRCRPGLVGPR